jgi:hypothetical protein
MSFRPKLRSITLRDIGDTAATDWITAVAAVLAAGGTVGAFAAALWQIKQERDARKRLESEVRQRERRAQAQRISAWPASEREGQTIIALLNRSEEPVYRAVVTLVFIQGAAPATAKDVYELGRSEYGRTLSLIPPGRHETCVAGGWGGMSVRPGTELAFSDRAGVHWLRAADGTLTEIPKPPVEYYEIGLPVEWSLPTKPRNEGG